MLEYIHRVMLDNLSFFFYINNLKFFFADWPSTSQADDNVRSASSAA